MTEKSKKYKIISILAQVSILTLLVLFPVFSFSATPVVMYKSIFLISLLASLFYLNMNWLIPRFLFKKKTGKYIILLLSILIIIIFLNSLYDNIFDFEKLILKNSPQLGKEPTAQMNGTFRIMPIVFLSILAIAISVSYKTINEFIKKEQENKEYENQKLNAELAMLKSQINPHFLFNILNNICSLALKKSDDTANAIIKLSDLMRYMIYDSSTDKVPLNKELQYIENYINLQRMRLAGATAIDYNVTADNMDKQIAPLLLIPFIENAFKHGISYAHNATINIQINTNGKKISLLVKNNNYRSKDLTDNSDSGIGLDNVKKRLDLLYPKSYKLTINDTETIYTVELEVILNA
jgi:sensor histidine kinase YesM